MRWTRQRQACNVTQGGFEKARERSNGELTNDVAAYGEVVWSWHRDAGVKFAESWSAPPGMDKTYPLTRVAIEPVHPGEREVSRKTIACGNVG